MNKDFKIYAYKHDGSFHRMWNKTTLLSETKDYFIVDIKPHVKVYEDSNHFWFTRDQAVCYFSKKRWFNIIVIYRPTDVVYYCNLASPILKELDSFKYIDYDLDLKYFSESKRIKILDRHEFTNHCIKYNYPEWIVKKVEKELKILQTWAKNEIGPFSSEFRNKWDNRIEEFYNE